MEFVRSRSGDNAALRVGDTAPALIDAAARLEDVDDFSSRETYLESFAALMYAGRLGEPGALREAANAARAAVDRTPESPRAVDLLLKGMTERISGGVRAGSTSLRAALQAMRALAEADETQVRRWLVPAFPILQESAAHEVWDEGIVHDLSAAVVRQARAAGVLAGLPQALVYSAGAHVLAGEFAMATRLIEEARSIAEATSQHGPVRYHSLLLDAWRGNPNALSMIDAAADDARARGEGRLLGLTGLAAAMLYNGQGRYDVAFGAAREACRHEDLGFYGWALFELVESAVHSGETDIAVDAVQELDDRAGASETDWGLGVLAAARAMLAGSDSLFREAIDRLSRTRAAVYLARAHLSYGEWLRRGNRRTDARVHLNAAYDSFLRMGADAFAERARRELIAVGEKVRKQPISSGDELTAQEAQIAQAAAGGLTNQEIGAQLFISTHTVEWHLRKVFVKLGISSRRQLRTMSWAS